MSFGFATSMSAPAPEVPAGGVRGAGQGPFTYDLPVYVAGLQGRVDLNHRGARICEWAPRAGDGRIGIQMLCSPDERVWIKPENLTVLSFAEELQDSKYAQMSDTERLDISMYMHASRGSQPVPGMNAVSMSTFTDDRPLSEREKSELLHVGHWGRSTSRAEWEALVSQIKSDRNNVYPRDWHTMVVSGGLYVANGQPTHDCMSISSDFSAVPVFGGDTTFDDLEHDEEQAYFDAADIFFLKYPGYGEADSWADNADFRNGAEYGQYVHRAFKKVFESKHSHNVIAEAGRELAQKGGLQSMTCNFYNYNVITTTMCIKAGIPEHVYKEWWAEARVAIDKAWDGVGGWRK
tara:strand:- start:296 stop:1342 length:1047 start_codon:yes stop_codon:yes gene_type:complete